MLHQRGGRGKKCHTGMYNYGYPLEHLQLIQLQSWKKSWHEKLLQGRTEVVTIKKNPFYLGDIIVPQED